MSFLAACCGCFPDETLRDSFDSKPFSPILNLDPHIADFAYKRMKRTHNMNKGFFERKFPARKDLDIIVNWDEVDFDYSAPKPMKQWKAEKKRRDGGKLPQPSNVNGNVEDMSASQGDNPDNTKENESKEVFKVIYDNTTAKEITDVKLLAERKIKATYTVEVSKSLEVGHNLQIGLKSPEGPGGVEAGYEFSRLLSNSKREEKADEVETTLNTETTLDVEKNQSALAEVTTKFQTYKETVVIDSTFVGTLNIMAREKKKRGRSQRKTHHLALTTGVAVDGMKSADEDLFKGFDIYTDTKDKDTIHYTSVVTLSSNTGVDRHIVIKKMPLSGDNPQSPSRNQSAEN